MLPVITGRDLARHHRSAGQRGAVGAMLYLREAAFADPTRKQAAALADCNLTYLDQAAALSPDQRQLVADARLDLRAAAPTKVAEFERLIRIARKLGLDRWLAVAEAAGL
jgi:hypothetical protein